MDAKMRIFSSSSTRAERLHCCFGQYADFEYIHELIDLHNYHAGRI